MNSFEKLRKVYEKEDEERDKLIKQSREIVKLSKKVIYSVHRHELSKAKKYLSSMQHKIRSVSDKKEPYSKIAVQEYVEAKLFYDYVNTGKLTMDKLRFDVDEVLLGICDLTGELMRYATNCFINNNFKTVLEVKKVMDTIYDELGLFDFRNSELRRKYDSIKYSVKKIDDLVIEIKKLNN